MISLKKWALLLAIKKCLKRRAPRSIPGNSNDNYFVPILKAPKQDIKLLIDELSGTQVHGLHWSENQFDRPDNIEIADLETADLEVIRFYGRNRTHFDSLYEFWFATLTCKVERKWFKEFLRQYYFNRVTRFQHDRMFVLKQLIENHLRKSESNDIGWLLDENNDDSMFLLTKLYGLRVLAHPSYPKESAHFELVLESLVATNDLEKMDMNRYKLSPVALSTVAEYEREERRHRDNVVHNRWIFLLTVVLAITAIVQVLL